MKRLFDHYLATGLYLFAIAAVFVYLQNQQNAVKQQQIAACERGNVIRGQMNTVSASLVALLTAASEARAKAADEFSKAGQDDLAANDRQAAATYRALIPGLTAIPLVRCSKL